MIVKRILREIGWSGMDWTDLARDRDQWRAHPNTVIKLRDLKYFEEVLVKLSDWQALKNDSAPWK
jgi:hypothetical protein